MTQTELKEILTLHEKWLKDNTKGCRAIFQNVDLSFLNLCNANLSEAIFQKVCLYNTNLSKANLSEAIMQDVLLFNSDLAFANFRQANLQKADLRGAILFSTNLSYANLRDASLERAKMQKAILVQADLSGANMFQANLKSADLSGAVLRYSILQEANLYNANLYGAVLHSSNLRNANFCKANLRKTDFRNSDLSQAKLNDIIYDENISGFFSICPTEGSYIGYKKANDFIIKLLITEDAKRSSATTRKCRASKAKVLSITNLDGSPANAQSVKSNYDPKFIYTVGETIEIKDFCEDRWEECAPGIHHFITREEAVMYKL